jgi:G:T/U-mismatch repair DNA glycosylase
LAATGLLGGDRLGPEDDHRVRDYGIGLTDVVKHRAESSDARLRQEDFGAAAFVEKILLCQPEVIAFNGEKVGTVVARHLRQPPIRVNGPGAWRIGESHVYRLPSSSPAAATIGEEAKTAAWVEFGEWVRALDG